MDETLSHALVTNSLTEPMRQNNRRLNAYNSTLVISRIFHIIVPLCGETMVIDGFSLQRESNDVQP